MVDKSLPLEAPILCLAEFHFRKQKQNAPKAAVVLRFQCE